MTRTEVMRTEKRAEQALRVSASSPAPKKQLLEWINIEKMEYFVFFFFLKKNLIYQHRCHHLLHLHHRHHQHPSDGHGSNERTSCYSVFCFVFYCCFFFWKNIRTTTSSFKIYTLNLPEIGDKLHQSWNDGVEAIGSHFLAHKRHKRRSRRNKPSIHQVGQRTRIQKIISN